MNAMESILKRFKLVSVGLITGFVGLLVYLSLKPDPLEHGIDISLLGTTHGQPITVFMVTNQTRYMIDYWIRLESKRTNGWSDVVSDAAFHYEERKRIDPHGSVQISVEQPAALDNWRISLWCVKTPGTYNSTSSKIRDFLEGWQLNWLANRLPSDNPGFRIAGPEMTQHRQFRDGYK